MPRSVIQVTVDKHREPANIHQSPSFHTKPAQMLSSWGPGSKQELGIHLPQLRRARRECCSRSSSSNRRDAWELLCL